MLDTSIMTQDDITAAMQEQTFGALHTGEVTVSTRAIDAPYVDDIIVPVQANGQKFELAFTGVRADLYSQGVLAYLAGLAAACDKDDVTLGLDVEGSWTKRAWMSGQGRVHTVLRLDVARWSYTTHQGRVTDGALPA